MRGTLRCPSQGQRRSDILEETRAVSPARLRRPFYTAAFPKKPTFPFELERVLDMLNKTPEVSRDTCPNSRGTLRFPPQVKKSPVLPASTLDEALVIPAVMREESRGAPHKNKEDLTSLRRHEQSPRSTRKSRRTLRFLPQLKANY